jgi:hypothetical protein
MKNKIRTLPPLRQGDFVKIFFQNQNNIIKNGTVVLQDNNELLNYEGKYKIDFNNGFFGWHERQNIRIIKRA